MALGGVVKQRNPRWTDMPPTVRSTGRSSPTPAARACPCRHRQPTIPRPGAWCRDTRIIRQAARRKPGHPARALNDPLGGSYPVAMGEAKIPIWTPGMWTWQCPGIHGWSWCPRHRRFCQSRGWWFRSGRRRRWRPSPRRLRRWRSGPTERVSCPPSQPPRIPRLASRRFRCFRFGDTMELRQVYLRGHTFRALIEPGIFYSTHAARTHQQQLACMNEPA